MRFNILFPVPALVAVFFLAASDLRAEERWYVFAIGGTPVGYVVEDTAGERTRTVVFARLTRLGKSIEMRFETVATEDTRGDLRGLTYEARLSKQPVRLDAVVEGDRIRLTSAQGPPRDVERGGERILGPAAVARLTASRLRAADDSIEYAVFSPELQRVARVRRRVLAVAARVDCGNATATKIEETIEGLPAPRTLWLSADGVLLADSVTGPFGAMTTCRATKEAAMAANGTLPADLYERTLARANVRFADAAALDRVVLRVRARDAADRLPDFASHNQRVLQPGVVEIRRPSRHARQNAPAMPAEFVEPNALVESNDPDVVRAAKQSAGGNAYDTALALTAWTAENLSMDAGIVFAPASELIRDRKATCMGYATLLAALARAAGLPSRVVMGYVYYGGIWGGHAWTEIAVDGQWLPFDAAVFAPGIASAARLSVGASSLADGGGSLMGALGALFGKVDVQTLEYEYGGRVKRVVDGQPAFETPAGTYVNRGLGIRVPAAGWTIERAGSTWPATLVVAFRRGETVVELHQKPRYPDRPLTRDGDAMFTSAEGATLWTWSARGPGADDALRGFLARFERVE